MLSRMADLDPRLLRRMNAQRVLDALRETGATAGHRAGRRAPGCRGRRWTRSPTTSCGSAGSRRWRAVEAPRAAARRAALAFRADAGYVVGRRHRRGQGARGRRRPARRGGRRARARVRRRGAAAGDPASRPRTLKDAGIARSCCLACVGCTGAMDTPRGRVLFCSVFPDDFDLAGALAGTLGRADRDRERLQPGRDRRALAAAPRAASTTSSACSRASGSARASWSAAS